MWFLYIYSLFGYLNRKKTSWMGVVINPLLLCTGRSMLGSCISFWVWEIRGKWDFPGGPGVKNPPSNAGDAGSIPGQGTKIPHAAGQLSPHATTTEPMCSRAHVAQLERSPRATRKDPECRKEDPMQPNILKKKERKKRETDPHNQNHKWIHTVAWEGGEGNAETQPEDGNWGHVTSIFKYLQGYNVRKEFVRHKSRG